LPSAQRTTTQSKSLPRAKPRGPRVLVALRRRVREFLTPAHNTGKRTPLEADQSAHTYGVLRLQKCFAFAKHFLRSALNLRLPQLRKNSCHPERSCRPRSGRQRSRRTPCSRSPPAASQGVLTPARNTGKRTPLEADQSAHTYGVLRLQKCFAFAKHFLRSGRQNWYKSPSSARIINVVPGKTCP
jgi:hypothetical protein